MSNRYNCYSCGCVFYGNFFSTKCNVCQQTESINNNAREQEREREYQHRQTLDHEYRIHQENLAAAALQSQILVEAIEKQTKTIVESAITSKEAYNHGFQYIDNEFINGNPARLDISIQESGNLQWTCDDVYITQRLQEQFSQGLHVRLNETAGAKFEYLVLHAERAGMGNADGSLPSYFSLHTGVKINGIEIPSVAFESNFKSSLDEDTGELQMTWTPPFVIDELNESYHSGVNGIYFMLNTNEMKQSRLDNEIAVTKYNRSQEEKARRDKIRSVKNTGLFYFFCLLMCLFGGTAGVAYIFVFYEWYVITVAVLAFLWAMEILIKSYNQWQFYNQGYLHSK